MHCYIVIVQNLYTKTFKTLLHVSILRSSSGSTYCSLLKLYVKTINTLLHVPAMLQHIVLYLLQGGPSTELPARDTTSTHTTRYAAASPEHVTKYLWF